MVDLLLVPSPLLGPSTWAPVAQLLGGRVVRVDEAVAAADGLAEVVLVPHSNAGLWAPSLVEQVGAVATVYVDAALPASAGAVPLAPPRFLEVLRGLADDDGLLPPWTGWWDAAEVDPLFPDPATRAAVAAEEPRLPLTYFTSTVDVPHGWDAHPSAYLAFGATYAEEVAAATARDWPVTTLPGRHLHQLVAPAEVAAAITALVERVMDAG